ncbi:MAG: hypothetical protein DRO23_12815 [Thermoprotei archaeon]|nr:MAG: hypothetical protein DRO23_12815 [Thermoprotei archaeon]
MVGGQHGMSVLKFLLEHLGRLKIHSIDLKYLVLKNCIVHCKLLKEHEETFKEKTEFLARIIENDGFLKDLILVDARAFTILDGHHRFKALRKLGYEYILVFFVDYASPYVTVSTWRKDYHVTKEEVLKRALTSKKYPPRTSKHRLVGVTIYPSFISLRELEKGSRYSTIECYDEILL